MLLCKTKCVHQSMRRAYPIDFLYAGKSSTGWGTEYRVGTGRGQVSFTTACSGAQGQKEDSPHPHFKTQFVPLHAISFGIFCLIVKPGTTRGPGAHTYLNMLHDDDSCSISICDG